MITGLGWTAVSAFVGLAIAIVLGIAIAVLMASARVDRALDVPVPRRPAGDPGAGDRAADLVGLRWRHRLADLRLRDDLDLPDRHQHAVRPDVGRRGLSTTCSPCGALAPDPAAEAAVPGRHAGDLHRVPDLGRPGRRRRRRRRAVLPRGRQARHRRRRRAVPPEGPLPAGLRRAAGRWPPSASPSSSSSACSASWSSASGTSRPGGRPDLGRPAPTLLPINRATVPRGPPTA